MSNLQDAAPELACWAAQVPRRVVTQAIFKKAQKAAKAAPQKAASATKKLQKSAPSPVKKVQSAAKKVLPGLLHSGTSALHCVGR